MPKLVVVVEKDASGKIWECVLPEEGKMVEQCNSCATYIHMPACTEKTEKKK